MAFCKKCGKELEQDAVFCTNCGTSVTSKSNERKEVYDGSIHKCPSCGEILKSFMVNCPACGYELRGTKATNSVSELVKKIEIIESEREYGKDNILKSLNLDMTLSKTDEQKISLIRNFIIPNTKEDLYEFLILSKSNIEIDLYENTQMRNARLAVSDAWRAKFEQAYQKAKILFNNDERMLTIQTMYDETNESINKAKTRIWKLMGIVFGICCGVAIFVLIIVAIATNGFKGNELTSNNEEKNDIIQLSTNNADEKEQKNFSELDVQKNEIDIFMSEENEIKDFVNGFEEAQFSKYNSPASENGLDGTKIYIKGKLEKTEILKTTASDTILGFIKDEEGNTWLIMMHYIPAVTETHYDNMIGKNVICNVVYDGYSGKYNMPSTVLDEMLVLEDGTRLNGMQKLIEE